MECLLNCPTKRFFDSIENRPEKQLWSDPNSGNGRRITLNRVRSGLVRPDQVRSCAPIHHMFPGELRLMFGRFSACQDQSSACNSRNFSTALSTNA